MPESGRYRFCPMCAAALTTVADADGIKRVSCSECAWVYYPTNVLGVNIVVVTDEDEIVMILPLGEPGEAPAALPGGVVEYGESPEEAAIRETREETGLAVEIVRELGRWFDPRSPYGPMLSFMFEARVVGGSLRGSSEGEVSTFRRGGQPQISPNRRGSLRALAAFLEQSRADGGDCP